MKIRTWEKWYWGIFFAIMTSLLVWLALKKEGFEMEYNGEPKILSKTQSVLWLLLFIIPALWFWLMLRFWLLKSNDFICQKCNKEYSKNVETKKEICKYCYEKR